MIRLVKGGYETTLNLKIQLAHVMKLLALGWEIG
jgi:hypothetical protein